MTITIAVLFAVVAAGCFVAAARIQYAAVRTVAGGGRLRLRALARLCRDPRWLGGMCALAGGAGLHAVSLAFAPLAVVQPVGALSLVAITMLQARDESRRLSVPVVCAVAASTLGIAIFVVLAASTTVLAPAAAGGSLITAFVVAALAVAAVAVGLLGPAGVRCPALGVAGGCCYGLVAVLTHIAALQLRFGTAVPLLPVLGIAVAAVLGGAAVQHAYASGPPDVVMACTTVIDPLVAVGAGLLLLDEAAAASAAVVAGQIACAALATAGMAFLARSRGGTQRHDISLRNDRVPVGASLEGSTN
ncbi:MAG: hypothetical protein ACRDRL_05945 [Sciscionella sp.]